MPDPHYTIQRLEGKKILIIGGLGFIGSNIAQRCVALGASVAIYDACLDPYGWNFANIKEIRDKLTFVKGDTRDFEALKSVVVEQYIIYDCAAQISHLISVKDPFLDIDITLRGGMNILEIVRQHNKNAILIYAGTRGAVGKMVHKPITEDHPTNPVDINGVNKLAIEKYYLLYHQLHSMKTVVIRINNTYGERAQMRRGDYGIVNWFLRKAMLGEQIVINGDGSQTRDYNYVQDVVDDSPAQKAGLQTGDIIVSIDGKSIDGKGNEVATIIAGKKIGDVVTLSVWRDGKIMEVKAILAAAPNQ
jgi:nucleoside-diphosphate-sugar epimerase